MIRYLIKVSYRIFIAVLLNCINRLRTNLVHRNYICMINNDNWQQNKFLQCNFDITNERLTPLQPFSALYYIIPLRSIRFYLNTSRVQQYNK